ncbi:RsmE family RNA methyltransferase [Pseudanabaena yagii]|uniref:Ribosomal RNA small subunit methyltransferase E n=1 Tax=Pseudanabaena yagii GIHE-NHR1 TaxID=2722753 RepID=A0ABX1LTN3_9CYAN|nr:16S rRNA (uracil(1498)-N(3))-methyltransferase [Pseudanabaena yagii]NMF59523.1 16S rRNA (uracil(1498)-N(3))-methyltransferase [Pseudanabaena yagii GIHE-NHR1]
MLLPQPQKRRLQRVTLQPHQVEQTLEVNSAIALTSEQRHYLCNVLRLEIGAEFIALDRQGGWWLAKLSSEADNVQIIDKLENNSELDTQITLGVAMPKGSNIESVIRQSTELGVRQIVPLFSDRTIIKSGTEIGNQKRDRWQRIAEEAAELSLRTYVPEINAPQSFKTWLGDRSSASAQILKYICVTHPEATHLLPSLQSAYDALPAGEHLAQIMVATGCEGGWTAREEEIAIASGFIPVSLGDRVLSAVTAPVVALSIVSAFLDTK